MGVTRKETHVMRLHLLPAFLKQQIDLLW